MRPPSSRPVASASVTTRRATTSSFCSSGRGPPSRSQSWRRSATRMPPQQHDQSDDHGSDAPWIQHDARRPGRCHLGRRAGQQAPCACQLHRPSSARSSVLDQTGQTAAGSDARSRHSAYPRARCSSSCSGSFASSLRTTRRRRRGVDAGVAEERLPRGIGRRRRRLRTAPGSAPRHIRPPRPGGNGAKTSSCRRNPLSGTDSSTTIHVGGSAVDASPARGERRDQSARERRSRTRQRADRSATLGRSRRRGSNAAVPTMRRDPPRAPRYGRGGPSARPGATAAPAHAPRPHAAARRRSRGRQPLDRRAEHALRVGLTTAGS